MKRGYRRWQKQSPRVSLHRSPSPCPEAVRRRPSRPKRTEMTSVWCFGVVLSLLVGLARMTSSNAMFRVALALLGNWAAQLAYWAISGDSTPWLFNMLIDTLTATVILLRPSGKMQAALGVTFVFEIACHTAYAWLNLRHGFIYVEQRNYWEMLHFIAKVQIFLAGAWFLDGLAGQLFGDIYRRYVPWHRGVATSAHHSGMV